MATDSNIWFAEQPSLEEKQKLFKKGEQKAIAAALRAVQILAEEP